MTTSKASGPEGDDGFALLTVLVSMGVITAFLLASLGYVLASATPSRGDQDVKAATAAAQAGVEEYVARLNVNDNYWSSVDCANLALTPPPASGCGARPAVGVPVPGTTGAATYSYRLLSTNSSTARDGVIRLAVTGRSKSRSRELIAELAPSGFLQYIYFTDFESLDPALSKEVADPFGSAGNAALNNQTIVDDTTAKRWTFFYPRLSGTSTPCGQQHWYEGRSAPSYTTGKYLEYVYNYTVDGAGNKTLGTRVSGPTERAASPSQVISGFSCSEIQFTTGDRVLGPLKTNDALLVNGSVLFNSPVTETAWATAPDPARPWRGSGTPSTGTAAEPGYNPVIAGRLPMPASNAELINAASTASNGCVYTGATKITFTADGRMTVRSPGTSGAVPRCYSGGNTDQVKDLPAVLYVRESTAACTDGLGFPAAGEDLNQGATTDYDCRRGNAYVSGVVKGRITVGAANDVVVIGDTTYAGDVAGTPALEGADALGLIPQNFAWIYHPVKSDGSNLLATPVTKLDAAVLSVGHSFLVQNWNKGAKSTSPLRVRGVIAQRFRGPVGTGGNSGSGSGYLKDYQYDQRLRNAPPPYFLKPESSPYSVIRLTD